MPLLQEKNEAFVDQPQSDTVEWITVSGQPNQRYIHRNEEDLTIPLNYVGTKCVFDSRAPTEQELIMKNYTNAAR